MSTLRTFIAVELPGAVRKRAVVLINSLRGTSANVKWVAEENLHWTVKFLGDVPANNIPKVCDALTGAVTTCTPFRVEAAGAGAFPEASRPRTLWLGVGEGEQEFVDLHDIVDAALGDLGFREEHRRFRPHITLGRVRRSRSGIRELGELIQSQAEFDGGGMTVSELVVFSSELGKGGPTYQVLGRAKLGS